MVAPVRTFGGKKTKSKCSALSSLMEDSVCTGGRRGHGPLDRSAVHSIFLLTSFDMETPFSLISFEGVFRFYYFCQYQEGKEYLCTTHQMVLPVSLAQVTVTFFRF